MATSDDGSAVGRQNHCLDLERLPSTCSPHEASVSTGRLMEVGLPKSPVVENSLLVSLPHKGGVDSPSAGPKPNPDL